MLFGDCPKGNKFANTGVGENDIDSPLHLSHGLIETIKVGQFGNVSPNARNVATDCPHGRVELLLATAGDEGIGTLPHEEFCRSQPNPFCAASDDSDLAFELFRHSSLRCSVNRHVVRTTRNSAFPLIMRAYPSAAFASGNFSIMARTPIISAKRRVSCESVGIPPAQPLMPFLPKSNWLGDTSIGSIDAPTTSIVPFTPRPPINADIAFPLGAVARITLAPPSFCSSAAGSVAALSI